MAIGAVSGTVDFQPKPAGSQASAASGRQNLSDEQKKEVADLKKRDAEVKSHEQAHVAAGGQYVRGGPHFEYQTGPDGNQYAVGGEVSIDASPVSGSPQATITKMQVVIRAALAPAQPSGQDEAVAAEATQEEAKAEAELAKQSPAAPSGAPPAGGAPKAGTSGAKAAGKNMPLFPKTAADTYAKNSFFPSNANAGPVSQVQQLINAIG